MLVTTAAVLALASAGTATAAPMTATRVAPTVQAVSVPFLMTASVMQATQQPPAQPGGQVKVDVDLNNDRTVWYADPFWVVIGVAAVIVIVALVAMAARGSGSGGTTVIR
jgi:hypothetical protein